MPILGVSFNVYDCSISHACVVANIRRHCRAKYHYAEAEKEPKGSLTH